MIGTAAQPPALHRGAKHGGLSKYWLPLWLPTTLAAAFLCTHLWAVSHESSCERLGSVPLSEEERQQRYRRIEWLHIPKAGSSFGNTLIPWACPDLPLNAWVRYHGVAEELPEECRRRFRTDPTRSRRRETELGEHLSLHPMNVTDERRLRSIFTMIRSPRTKLVSGFHWVHREGRLPSRTNATEEEICNYVDKGKYAVTTKGAQVKQIVGEDMYFDSSNKLHFNNTAPPSQVAVEEACRRLRKFAFVGITDFWNTTVCLFHGMHGGNAYRFEYRNMRPTGYRASSDRSLREVDCGDWADEALFQCALEVFTKRVEQNPQCVRHLVAEHFDQRRRR